MAVDRYAPCPCGSGKKFKWCCQSFYGEIDKAFRQHDLGQHEVALRMMEKVSQDHADNPGVWGRRAELLWENGQTDKAEECLDRAVELNPNYAYGHFLRGVLRHNEMEMVGAATLYRKAAALCPSDDRRLLAGVYANAGICDLALNRPVAGLYALELAKRLAPNSERLDEDLAREFGENGRWPSFILEFTTALRGATFTERELQQRWNMALRAAEDGRLNECSETFEKWTEDRPDDGDAWYNYGLSLAWLGENGGAIRAFEEYITREEDDKKAAQVWAVAEILYLAEGMEERSDYVQHFHECQITDANQFINAIADSKRNVMIYQDGEKGIAMWRIVDRDFPEPDPDLRIHDLPITLAMLLLSETGLSLSCVSASKAYEARQYLESLCGDAIGPFTYITEPAKPQDIAIGYFSRLPPPGVNGDKAIELNAARIRDGIEQNWVNHKRRALGGRPPAEAVKDPILKKKVLGSLLFVESLLETNPLETIQSNEVDYSPERIRRKLGLLERTPGEIPDSEEDFSDLNEEDLAALEADKMSVQQLGMAFRASLARDMQVFAAEFAHRITKRDPESPPDDRYYYFLHLINRAASQRDYAEAESFLDAGMKYDCEHLGGNRRNDYQLRAARLHLENNDPEAAETAFDSLIQRNPSDLELLGSAAESMLRAGRKESAARFAAQGLTHSKSSSDRDRAEFFQELVDAANG